MQNVRSFSWPSFLQSGKLLENDNKNVTKNMDKKNLKKELAQAKLIKNLSGT